MKVSVFLLLLLLSLTAHLSWSEQQDPEGTEDEGDIEKEDGEDEEYEEEYIIPHTILSNDKWFPLVGYGVGNLQHELIESNVALALESHYRLIDTAHASHNEELIAKGIEQGLNNIVQAAEAANEKHLMEPMQVHVVTKVWYTYLGYERTKISVRESLKALMTMDPKYHQNVSVHMLLHWPRCDDAIQWMHCEQEENALPQHVKDAGPPPHLNKENAFLESWKALEDIYTGVVDLNEDNGGTSGSDASSVQLPKLASIGVSNFHLNDLLDMSKTWRVKPHIIQDNVWVLRFDPHLMAFLGEHDLHLQVYNVMNGILEGREDAPLAWDTLWDVARALSEALHEDEQEKGDVIPSQVILKWLMQRHVSVIPRTIHHIHENAPSTIERIPDLNDRDMYLVDEAVGALLKREDLQKPHLSFVNKLNDVLHLFWVDHGDSEDDEIEEVPVKMELEPGETWHTEAFEGHTFVAYDSQEVRREFVVKASFGEMEEFNIEPDL